MKEEKIKRYNIGCATGCFDLFHVGHLNLLKNAKSLCEKLIVGVHGDEFMKEHKGKKSAIPFDERIEIVRSIKYVDITVRQDDLNKTDICKKLSVDVFFVGDDWYNTDRWKNIEKELKEIGTDTIYLPYTRKTSSTMIKVFLEEERKNGK